MKPEEALNTLYNATRSLQTTAENHEVLYRAYTVLAEAISPKEKKDGTQESV